MTRFLADVHFHADYDDVRDHWHGEKPEYLAARIVHGTPLDLCALSEHNKVSDQYFDLCDELQTQQEVFEERFGVRKEVYAMLGMELAVMFENRRYHIGYVFQDRFQRGKLPEVPPARCDAAELEEYRHDYQGVVILNHPAWKDRSPSDLSVTKDFMKSGLVDGAEVVNGSIVYHKNGHSRETYDAARMFVDVRKEQQQLRSNGNGNGNGHTSDTPAPFRRLSAIGGSDAHTARAVGYAATAYHAEHPLGYFDAVRRGLTTIVPLDTDRVVPGVKKLRDEVKGMAQFLLLPEQNGIETLRKKKKWWRKRRGGKH